MNKPYQKSKLRQVHNPVTKKAGDASMKTYVKGITPNSSDEKWVAIHLKEKSNPSPSPTELELQIWMASRLPDDIKTISVNGDIRFIRLYSDGRTRFVTDWEWLEIVRRVEETLTNRLTHAGIADAHVEDIDKVDHQYEWSARELLKSTSAGADLLERHKRECQKIQNEANEWYNECDVARNQRDDAKAEITKLRETVRELEEQIKVRIRGAMSEIRNP